MKRFYPIAWTAGLFAVSALLESGLCLLRDPLNRPGGPTEAQSPAPATLEIPAEPAAAAFQPQAAKAPAAPTPERRHASDSSTKTASALTSRAVVAVDPETGALGMPERTATEFPTIDEIQAQARLEAAGLVTVRHPDGSESIEHEGRFTDYAVVHTGPDGKLHFTCAHGQLGLKSVMRKDRPVRPALEEE